MKQYKTVLTNFPTKTETFLSWYLIIVVTERFKNPITHGILESSIKVIRSQCNISSLHKLTFIVTLVMIATYLRGTGCYRIKHRNKIRRGNDSSSRNKFCKSKDVLRNDKSTSGSILNWKFSCLIDWSVTSVWIATRTSIGPLLLCLCTLLVVVWSGRTIYWPLGMSLLLVLIGLLLVLALVTGYNNQVDWILFLTK